MDNNRSSKEITDEGREFALSKTNKNNKGHLTINKKIHP